MGEKIVKGWGNLKLLETGLDKAGLLQKVNHLLPPHSPIICIGSAYYWRVGERNRVDCYKKTFSGSRLVRA